MALCLYERILAGVPRGLAYTVIEPVRYEYTVLIRWKIDLYLKKTESFTSRADSYFKKFIFKWTFFTPVSCSGNPEPIIQNRLLRKCNPHRGQGLGIRAEVIW